MSEPLAFRGVGLRAHLAAVGAIAHKLFSERLTAAGRLAAKLRELTGFQHPLMLAALIAASLHDVGKTSPYYQEDRRAESFPGHEIVGAVILLRACRQLDVGGKDGLAIILRLVAWAIARHHASMRNRHPQALLGTRIRWRGQHSSSLLGEAVKALKRLRGEDRDQLVLKSLPQPLQKAFDGVLVDVIAYAVRELANSNNVQKLVWKGVRELTALSGRLERLERVWNAYVSTITGVVTVADILTASVENRETDDGMAGYARWWTRELGADINSLKKLARNTNFAEETLEEALRISCSIRVLH